LTGVTWYSDPVQTASTDPAGARAVTTPSAEQDAQIRDQRELRGRVGDFQPLDPGHWTILP
jgi:hypothetical protein